MSLKAYVIIGLMFIFLAGYVKMVEKKVSEIENKSEALIKQAVEGGIPLQITDEEMAGVLIRFFTAYPLALGEDTLKIGRVPETKVYEGFAE